MHKLYTNEKLSIQFAIFMLIQPFIDIYRLFVGNRIEIAGISLVELMNIIMILYLGILFILNQRKIKTFALAFVYGALLLLYLPLHCHNILQFDNSIISGTQVNIIVELYVIARMYILPLAVLYMLVFVKTKEQRFMKTVVGLSGFISLTIIITNLFKVSFISYASGLEKNEMIRQNIIEWFIKKPPEDLNLITSKGWFYSGNQIGLILLMLYPLTIYYAVTKKRWYGYLLVALQAVAMVMVSTKTSALGAILVLIIMACLQLIFSIYEKNLKSGFMPLTVILLMAGLTALLIQNAPVKKMIYAQGGSHIKSEEEKELEESVDEFVKDEFDKDKFDVDSFAKFMGKYYYIYGIQEEYVKLLPVQEYPEFWLSVISDPNKGQVNFRNFKKKILAEVMVENDNMIRDKWLGIGYTTNFPYLEKDVAAQSAWFGIGGTLVLMGPYALVFLIAVMRILLNLKREFKLFNCALGLSICSGMGAALIAGHLFGYFFPILIFTYILTQLYHQTIGNKNGMQKPSLIEEK